MSKYENMTCSLCPREIDQTVGSIEVGGNVMYFCSPTCMLDHPIFQRWCEATKEQPQVELSARVAAARRVT